MNTDISSAQYFNSFGGYSSGPLPDLGFNFRNTLRTQQMISELRLSV